MTTVTENQIATQLRKADGVISHAADKLGVTRQAIYQRINASEKLKAIVQDIEDRMVDGAEGNVAKGVREGDKDMTKLVLQTKGRKRGWGQKVDVGIDDATAEAIIGALGGDPAKYRALLSQLGVHPAEIPG